MIPTRPYLIRALYEWIVDNDWTPHVLIDAAVDDVNVPPNSVNEEGRVVLNIGPGAVEGLVMNNDGISFSARFGGVATPVSVPTMSVSMRVRTARVWYSAKTTGPMAMAHRRNRQIPSPTRPARHSRS